MSQDRRFLALLGRTLASEGEYAAEIEGTIPPGLRGTLYRNGPGRFERGGVRKPLLLDGDGMVQRFRIADGGVSYRNRFVRTDKYVAEEAAGAYRHATWSMRAPGGVLANIGVAKMRSQAGVTVYPAAGRLLAWDEVGLPWAVDPDSLDTIGEVSVAGPEALRVRRGKVTLKAHARFDAHSGHWMLLGVEYGPSMVLHLFVQDRDGNLLAHHSHAMPRQVYLHDFLATESHVVVLLHPLVLSPLPFVMGTASFVQCLRWRPEQGMVVAAIDKAGHDAPLLLDAPAAYMWHGLNAFRDGDSLVVDWVGFDAPDHFVGPDPALAAIMEGRQGDGRSAGTVRRMVIDLARRRLVHETVADGNFEFPSVAPGQSCRRHRFGYVNSAGCGDPFADGLARIDTVTGDVRAFHFGPGTHVGEPVLAEGEGGEAWLLAQCLDGAGERSFLAVFDAGRVEDGPVARAWCRHHLPASFHGSWVPAP
ncbi:MAG: carotenoid oxygenase family protein [Magnetospirillum sp.]|nr:carotenoid oxygenase family protein [Magnetospirillum sp.]